MANLLHVKSGGTPASPYATWTDAATDFQTALGAAVAGDIIYVDSGFSEAFATSQTFASPGTDIAPLIIISTDSTTGSPTSGGAYLAGATLTSSGTPDFTFSGKAITYGVDYLSGDDWFASADSHWRFHDCDIGTNRDSAGSDVLLGAADSVMEFDNVGFSFVNAGGGLVIGGGHRFEMRNCHIANVAITDFIKTTAASRGAHVLIDGCNFSGMNATGEIIEAFPTTTNGQNSVFTLSNNLLPSNGTITNASIVTSGTLLEAYNCSTATADEANSYYVQTINGTANNDTANYKTSTANGGNQWSIEMDTESTAQAIHEPLRILLGEVYAAADATITVEVASEDPLQDDEFWIEVVYTPITAGHASNRLTATSLLGWNKEGLPDIGTASSSALTTGTTWTTQGATNLSTPEYGKCVIDLGVDPTVKSDAGVVQVWVNLGKPNLTAVVYVDSEIVVT